MTEKLKYKVGDKVLVEAEICTADNEDKTNLPYRLKLGYRGIGWYSEEDIQKHIHTNLPPKPKITQAVMDWYFKYQECRWDVDSYLTESVESGECYSWLFTGNRQLDSERQHALATLIAYGPKAVEIGEGKRYRVYLVGVKNQWNQRQCLTNNEDNYFFSGRCMIDTTYTKQELIEAGFEGVFDNEMFEVEEVE